MRYFVVAGEPSGDLHAGHLMDAIRLEDANAEIRYWYRPDLAYMGFVSVAMHLCAIFRGMKECRSAIRNFKPDRLILVDYPGFNLNIAAWFHRGFIAHRADIGDGSFPKVIYYIPPKVWAWKEGRVSKIKRYVDKVLSILPFEVEWYAQKHDCHVYYVGNPTLDEVSEYRRTITQDEVGQWRKSLGLDGSPVLALMPGSRRQEIECNLPLMLRAAHELGAKIQYIIALAPNIPQQFYNDVISGVFGHENECDFCRRIILSPCQGSRSSFLLLHNAHAALVTSGTATLETAIMNVPQVVCYAMRCGKIVSWLRHLFLKVPYVSLVNLIAGADVVPELVAGDLTLARLKQELEAVVFDENYRERQKEGYAKVMSLLGEPGAPERASALIVR